MENGEDFLLGDQEEWKHRADGIATFKMPTMQHGTLWNEDVLCKGYWPKMLLYALDKLFFIFDQVKQQRGIDKEAHHGLRNIVPHGTVMH